MRNLKLRSLLFAVSILFLSLTLVGCKSDPANTTPPPNSTTPPVTDPQTPEPATPEPINVDVTIYYPTADAVGLVPSERTLTVKDKTNEEVIKEIFKEFMNPPSDLVAPLPEGTELLDVTIKDGIATLNLSDSFRKNFAGGATGEQMVIYSIVNSLTMLPDVDSVEFLLNGELQAAILGGLDTSVPVPANESLILK